MGVPLPRKAICRPSFRSSLRPSTRVIELQTSNAARSTPLLASSNCVFGTLALLRLLHVSSSELFCKLIRGVKFIEPCVRELFLQVQAA